MAEVILEGLSKHYAPGQPAAVDGVSATIADGEFFVLLGPSGCGKSTTLRMIAGLEAISAGALWIAGRRVDAVPAKDRDIAMVFQSYALYPHMSVRDNLAFGLRRRRLPEAELQRRVAQAAQSLALEAYLDRKPHALSGGQRQRVALGRAIVREPKVFLFDEPLSNLDASLRVSTRAELGSLHRRLGATMIYVTHDQVEAMTMGTRICIMRNGRVEQIGAPLQVYRQPANTFVAGFLGSPPMNLLPVHWQAAAGRPALGLAATAGPAVTGTTRTGPTLAAEALLARVQLPTPVPSLLLGIRPEDVRLAAPSEPGALAADVVASEALGAETLATLRLPGDGTLLRARLDRDHVPTPGDRISIAFDLARGRLFDAATGRACLHLDD